MLDALADAGIGAYMDMDTMDLGKGYIDSTECRNANNNDQLFANFLEFQLDCLLAPNRWRKRCFWFACHVFSSPEKACSQVPSMSNSFRVPCLFSGCELNEMNQPAKSRMAAPDYAQCIDCEWVGKHRICIIHNNKHTPDVQESLSRTKYDIRMKSQTNLGDHIDTMEGKSRAIFILFGAPSLFFLLFCVSVH